MDGTACKRPRAPDGGIDADGCIADNASLTGKRGRLPSDSISATTSEGTAPVALPIAHSAPVDFAAMNQLMHRLQQEVGLLKAQVCALTAQNSELTTAQSLLEQEAAIAASHPSVPVLVRNHSQLWRTMYEPVAGKLGSHWLRCLQDCPVQPLDRCVQALAMLAALQASPAPPPFRIFAILREPLFDCLAASLDGDLVDMVAVGDYVQLPKPLVLRVQQQREAALLRSNATPPAALPAALQSSVALRPLLQAGIAAVPDVSPPFSQEIATDALTAVDPDLDDAPDAEDDEIEVDDIPDGAREHAAMLADPLFLRGLCGDVNVSPIPGGAFRKRYLAGLCVAGLRLPDVFLRTWDSLRWDTTPLFAAAVGNCTAMQQMLRADERACILFVVAAAAFGQIDALSWSIKRYQGERSVVYAPFAALFNDLKPLQMLVDWGCALSAQAALIAARRGDLRMLQWLRERDCPWDGSVLAEAAAGGHRDVIEWSLAQGCPRDARACAGAAKAGDLPLLRWLRSRDLPWDARVYVHAARGQHLAVMQFARENGCPWGAGNAVCEAAALGGSREVLRWCREQGAAWGPRTCAAAAQGGHMELMLWLVERGCPLNLRTPLLAAMHGRADILRWTLSHDESFTDSPDIMFRAAGLGECIRVAVEAGCPEDVQSAAEHAGAEGDLDMVRWLVEREVGVDRLDARASIDGEICNSAAEKGHIHVLDWMFGRELAAEEKVIAAVKAAESSQLETLEWLMERGVRFDERVAAGAASAADMTTLQWLRDVAHCRWDATACEEAAGSPRRDRNLQVLKWLVAQGCPLSEKVWERSKDSWSEESCMEMRKFLCTLPARPWSDKLVLWAVTIRDTDAVDWALSREPGAQEALRQRGYAAAIRSGEVDMLRVVRNHCGGGYGLVWDQPTWSDDAVVALGRASLEMMRKCVALDCPLQSTIWQPLMCPQYEHAAYAELLPRLELLRRHNCPWDPDVAALVAGVTEGNRAPADSAALLLWLRSNGCPVSAAVCAAAAKHSLPLLQELRANAFPWDSSTCVAAAQAGQLATLQWAHGQACPLEGCRGIVVPSQRVRAWLAARGVASVSPTRQRAAASAAAATSAALAAPAAAGAELGDAVVAREGPQ